MSNGLIRRLLNHILSVLYTLLISVAVVWNILVVETRADNIIQLLGLNCSQFIL